MKKLLILCTILITATAAVTSEKDNLDNVLRKPDARGPDVGYALLVKGELDYIAHENQVVETVDHPSFDAMEAIGGTGDSLTGLLTALCGAGFKAIDATCLAAKTNRWAGYYANPNPATQVIELIDKIPQALSRLLGNESKVETQGRYQKISECTK